MGQRLSDAEAVDAIARNVVRLVQGDVLSGEAELVRELPGLGVSAESFRAEIRLQGDRLAWDSPVQRTMVAVRFFKSIDLPDEPWTVYVRVDWPERRDRLAEEGPLSAKALRRMMAPERRRPKSSTQDMDWDQSEDVWVSPDGAPSGKLERDLRAQMALFLGQIKLLSEPGASAVAQQLIEYLRRDRGLTEDVAAEVRIRAMSSYWWPPGWRSWRVYVRRTAHFVHIEQAGYPPAAPDLEAALLTIAAVSELTRIPKSTLYQRAKEGRLLTDRDPEGRIVVPRAEARRLTTCLTPRAAVEYLVRRGGLTRAAARKRDQRHKGALEDLPAASSKHKR